MPFRFVYVCDLLEQLSNISERDPPYLPKDAEKRTGDAIVNWFKTHRLRIDDHNTDGVALLSALLPERRTDKVYFMQAQKIERYLGRALALSNSRMEDLRRWRDPGKGDLADCLERVLRQAENAVQTRANEVTTEEIEEVLLQVASKKRFSSPAVRLCVKNVSADDTTLLGRLYKRVQSREAKWLTRLILKNYSPVIIPESLIYRCYHYLLPDLMKVQSEFTAALELLRNGRLKGSPSMPSEAEWALCKESLLKDLLPKVGVKIGRPPFFKARSIKHCVNMTQNRRMSVEKKYDGEYCQVHIDMTKERTHWIKIFSKSGNDSTMDRIKVHDVIFDCLGLGKEECKISERCILEGELVVYSDKEHKVLDFHKIRKHVSRSGSLFASGNDSQAHPWEHLMIVFFDVMLLDDIPVLHHNNGERRQHLENIIKVIPGRAELAKRQTIQFLSLGAAAELRKAFAKCIATQGEGLVMKPTDEPYFNFTSSYNAYRSCYIKLKKEYIGKFGDVGDFAVVGASYDSIRAKTLGIPSLKYTQFWLACLENKEEVQRWPSTRPRFTVITTVEPKTDIIEEFFRLPTDPKPETWKPNDFLTLHLNIVKGVANGKNPTTVFANPPVFDMSCFGFDKEGNTGFWTIRFPQVTKLHLDRSWQDTMSFHELQIMAAAARTCAEEDLESQEDLKWIAKLKKSDPRGVAVDAVTPSVTGESQSTEITSTPRRRVESTASPLATRAGLVRVDTQELLRVAKTTSTSDLISNQDQAYYITPSVDRNNPRLQSATSGVGTPESRPSSPKTAATEDQALVVSTLPVSTFNLSPNSHIGTRYALPSMSSWLVDGLVKLHSLPTIPSRAESTSSNVAHISPPIISLKRTLIDHSGAPLRKRQCCLATGEINHDPTSSEPNSIDSRTSSGSLCDITNSCQRRQGEENMQTQQDYAMRKRNNIQCNTLHDKENITSGKESSGSVVQSAESPLTHSVAHSENPYVIPTSTANQPQNLRPTCLDCRLLELGPRPCDFSECHIYLSPCVSGISYLTEDLMKFHGATYSTDMKALQKFPKDFQGRTMRKFALVEIRRKKQTLDIMHQIKDLDLNEEGTKTWVEIYDHRLLEALYQYRTSRKDIGADLWKKCWIAAV